MTTSVNVLRLYTDHPNAVDFVGFALSPTIYSGRQKMLGRGEYGHHQLALIRGLDGNDRAQKNRTLDEIYNGRFHKLFFCRGLKTIHGHTREIQTAIEQTLANADRHAIPGDHVLRDVQKEDFPSTLDAIFKVIGALEEVAKLDSHNIAKRVRQLILPAVRASGIVPSFCYISPENIRRQREEVGISDRTEYSRLVFAEADIYRPSARRYIVEKMEDGFTPRRRQQGRSVNATFRYTDGFCKQYLCGVNKVRAGRGLDELLFEEEVEPFIEINDEHRGVGMEALPRSQGNIVV